MHRALDTVRRHPRHLVLGAAVAGLLAAPAGYLVVLPAALVFATLAGRPGLATVAIAALLGAAVVCDARLQRLDAGVLGHGAGQVVRTHAVVLEPVRERMIGPAVARVRLLDGFGAGEQAVLRVRRHTYGASGWPAVGDIVGVDGVIAPLGVADAYQRRRNAHAVIVANRVVPTGTRRGGVPGALDSVRRRAERGLAAGLQRPEAALLRGMVLGEDEGLDDSVREDFQRSGLAHILAVSGQNVVLLIVLVLAACALTGVPLRTRLILAAAVVVVYVPLAGGGPSIQRAGVMGVAGLIAALAGRPARRWYALLLAAAVTLLLNPRAAGEPGWQLSFAAVVALLVGANPLKESLARRLPDPAADAIAITVAATVGTAPLMALHFGQLSLAALPANLLAAPAIAPVMWLGVLAGLVGQVAAPLAWPFTALTAPLLVYLQQVAHITAGAPLAAVEVEAPPAVIVAGWLAFLGAVWATARRWRRMRARWSGRPEALRAAGPRALLRALIVVAAALGVAIPLRGAHAAQLRPGELRVSFLDVGQGDATLIQLGASSVLVDTGPPDGPILKRLEEAHVHRLDALFLTHAEADHEGAAPAVIAQHAPRLVVDGGAGWSSRVQRLLPRALASARARELTPASGQRIDVGGLRFAILWPSPTGTGAPAPGGNPNDHAIVARLEHGTFSMLLTADAESNVTLPLDLAPVDVLKVAHHGSADPGLPTLLERLRPRLAAIEVGRRNSYGHPTKPTLAALERVVPTIVRTDRDGTIRLHVVGGRLEVER